MAVQADYVTVVEDRPIMFVKYCLPVSFLHFWPKLATQRSEQITNTVVTVTEVAYQVCC